MDLRDRSKTILESSGSLPRSLVVAVGVGLAFGAGVVVGAPDKGGAVDVGNDPVAAAAARTKLYEERMKGVQLSWPKELTSFDPALPAPPKTAATTTPKKAPLSEEASSSPIVDKAVVAAPPPEPVAQKVAAAVEEDAGVKDDDVVNAPDPKRLDAAISKVLGEPKKPAAEATSEKRYALQLASTGTEASARVLADGWVQKGVKASVVAADVAGKGTMYRVRVSGIASRAAADALKAKLGQGLVVAD